MSLYRAGLRLALFLPLGIAIVTFVTVGFTDVSSVFILLLRASATQIDRTRVRKSSAISSTCLSTPFILTARYPTGRENVQRFRLSFNESTPNKLHRDPMRYDPWNLNA